VAALVSRRDELAGALAAVEGRLAAACRAAGRPREDVTLVAVTKTRPVEDIALLADLGVRDVGESKDQEAAGKAAALAGAVPGLRWHVVGRLQRNKARSVATYAAAVHSVDRASLVHALSDGAVRAARDVEVLLQVSLDADPERGGVLLADLPALAALTAGAAGLRLRGLMAVAPRGADPDGAFGVLRELAEQLRRDHPDATWLSAGMSGDLEAAVRNGATHVRVGTALLGHRPPPPR
jgi:pyridoxal phosphate enzyme (YggS family)